MGCINEKMLVSTADRAHHNSEHNNVQRLRAGLFVVDSELDLVQIIERKQPYVSIGEQNARPNKFVEQYIIPRGCCNKNEDTKLCAIREFQEETKMYFKEILFDRRSFILTWEDPVGVIWRYTIYFAFADFSPKNVIRFNNTTTGRRRETANYVLQTMPLLKYIELQKDRIPLYGKNNYLAFLTTVKNIIADWRCLYKKKKAE